MDTAALPGSLPVDWKTAKTIDRRVLEQHWGPVQLDGMRRLAMGMNTSYDLEVRQHCPNAQVVYDLFHVIAKYG